MKISLRSVLQIVGSLFVAMILLAVLTAVLGLTTFIDSAYGEPVVRYFVYDSWWFHMLLFLFSMNVLGSMLLRNPLKKNDWPFWTVHSGILVLLVGCFITAKGNQEANLTIIEGKSARFAVAHGNHFALTPMDFSSGPPKDLASRLDQERQDTVAVPFDGGPLNWKNYSYSTWYDKTQRPYRFPLWILMKLAGRQSGVIFNHKAKNTDLRTAAGVKIEVLDYLSNSDKTPAGPLEMAVKWNAKDRASEKVKLQIAPQIGRLRGEDSMFELGLGAAQTFAQGEQMTFRIAESQDEVEAFLQSSPGEIASGLGVSVFAYHGKKHVISLDDVQLKQVAGRSQRDALRDQMSELMRKRQAAQNGTDSSLAESPKEIDARIARLFQEIKAADKESFYPIAGTNLSLEILRFSPSGALVQSDLSAASESEPASQQNRFSTGAMIHILLHTSGEETDQLLLYAGRPDLNTHAKKFGVYGTFCVNTTYSKKNALDVFPVSVLEQMSTPRLDFLQMPQGGILYRYWWKDRFLATGEVSSGQATSIVPNERYGVVLSDLKFTPHDLPGYRIVPVPYVKERRYVPDQRAKLRSTVDGVTEEFWILAQPSHQDLYRIPLNEEQVRWLHGKNGTVRLVYARNEVDLGFSLYLKKFTQKMEPGTQIAAQFSSLVDMRPPEETANRMDLVQSRDSAEMFSDERPLSGEKEIFGEVPAIRKDVLICMNQPGLFTDQFTGRKYRVYQSGRQGPIGPLSTNPMDLWDFHYLYDKELLPGETEPRDSLYKTILSVNYDPGRGLKYLGCAMLVFGTAWIIYGRKKRIMKDE